MRLRVVVGICAIDWARRGSTDRLWRELVLIRGGMRAVQSARNTPVLKSLSTTKRRRLLVLLYFTAIVSILTLFGVLTGAS